MKLEVMKLEVRSGEVRSPTRASIQMRVHGMSFGLSLSVFTLANVKH